MLTHAGIWQALDRLARKYNHSPSGLARRAGLDPTTFNRSKRISREGKPRWPSTESVAKVLDATGASLGEFLALVDEKTNPEKQFLMPVVPLPELSRDDRFDPGGQLKPDGFERIPFPDFNDPAAFAIELTTDDLIPVYRAGDLIVVSPAAAVRRGDRVVVRTVAGEPLIGLLMRQIGRRMDLTFFNSSRPDRSLDAEQVRWMARIVWASQ